MRGYTTTIPLFLSRVALLVRTSLRSNSLALLVDERSKRSPPPPILDNNEAPLVIDISNVDSDQAVISY